MSTIKAPETVLTTSTRGHPRVWIEIDERGYAECGYCDRRFVLKDGPADHV